jgi:hypothetical protein
VPLGSIQAAIWIASSLSSFPVLAEETTTAADRGEAARVALDMIDCQRTLEAEVRRIVGIEIGDLLLEPDALAGGSFDRLSIRCEGELARIEAARAGHDDHLARTLRLAEFPGDAAPRALALAGIEELAAFSPAVRQRIQQRRPSAPVPIARAGQQARDGDSTREPEPNPGAPWRLEVAAITRAFLRSDGLVAFGGGLGVDRGVGPHALARLDLDLGEGSRTVSLGEVHGLQASGGLAAGARFGGSSFSAALALGARFGIVRLSGAPANAVTVGAATVVRAWGGPLAMVRASAGVGPMSATLSVEAGVALVGAEGLADSAVALVARGPWVAASLGIGIRRAK